MTRRGVCWLSAPALLCAACFGTPTPLAPGLSGAVGLPHYGVQTGAVELPERGPGFVRFRKYGGFHWGQPGLVRAIASAARAVDERFPDGAPLLVGDLSAEFGGQIPRHASHRTGRDVDLLWYVTTPGGASIPNPGFLCVGPDGLAQVPETGAFVSIDIPRQWLLIKELLESPDIEVQRMFMSQPLESLLINYAIARAEDPELIWRAETVMLQPNGARPHDDHLHLRVACSPDEAVWGCEGGGPYWSWLPPLPLLPPMPEDELSLFVEEEPPSLLSLQGDASGAE